LKTKVWNPKEKAFGGGLKKFSDLIFKF